MRQYAGRAMVRAMVRASAAVCGEAEGGKGGEGAEGSEGGEGGGGTKGRSPLSQPEPVGERKLSVAGLLACCLAAGA